MTVDCIPVVSKKPVAQQEDSLERRRPSRGYHLTDDVVVVEEAARGTATRNFLARFLNTVIVMGRLDAKRTCQSHLLEAFHTQENWNWEP